MTPKVPTDIEIAQAAKPRLIAEVAAEAGLGVEEFLPYGRYKAKITPQAAAARPPKGRLVLVTGITILFVFLPFTLRGSPQSRSGWRRRSAGSAPR